MSLYQNANAIELFRAISAAHFYMYFLHFTEAVKKERNAMSTPSSNNCAVCSKPASQRCKDCASVYYCGRECQVKVSKQW